MYVLLFIFVGSCIVDIGMLDGRDSARARSWARPRRYGSERRGAHFAGGTPGAKPTRCVFPVPRSNGCWKGTLHC